LVCLLVETTGKQTHTGCGKTMEKLITMSHTELNRHSVMFKIEQKKISQTKAALVLNLSLRQLQRIYARYKVEGWKD